MNIDRNKTLLVGIGNSLRGDDALGLLLCEYFCLHPYLNTLTVPQLQTELLEDFINRERIIFADASVKHPDVSLEEIHEKEGVAAAISHSMDSKMMVRLFRKLYPDERTHFFTLALPAFDFELGSDLSEQGRQSLEAAKKVITQLLDTSF